MKVFREIAFLEGFKREASQKSKVKYESVEDRQPYFLSEARSRIQMPQVYPRF